MHTLEPILGMPYSLAIYCMFYLNDIDELKNMVEHLKFDAFN